MTNAIAFADPKKVAGIAVIVFGAWLGLEGALMLSVGQLLVAGGFVGLGWWLRKRGCGVTGRVSPAQPTKRWFSFFAVAIPVLVVAYFAGYLLLMDRHRPTSPAGAFTRFESSFRLAPREWVHKARTPYETPWGSVTTWNILYQPMDHLWFRYFPRSREETEALRKIGYYR